jgi:cupin superfamily acireductone dioxygenase involved in methionine salvage
MRFKDPPIKLTQDQINARLARKELERREHIASKKAFLVLEEKQQARAQKVNEQRQLIAQRDYWRRQGVKTAANDEHLGKLREHFHRDAARIADEFARRG